MTLHEPTRWSDQPAPSMTPSLARALGAYANQGPSSPQIERMGQRLIAKIEVGVQPQSGLRLRPNVWWLAGLAALGVLTAALLMLRSPTERAPRTPPRVEVVLPTRITPALSPGPAPLPVSPSVAPLPTTVVRRARVDKLSTRALTPAQPIEKVDPAGELALLTPARRLLAVKPARSLALAEEHAQAYPHGLFGEERSLIRIEALTRLGQLGTARQEATAFRQRFPASTYLVRVNELVPAK